MPSQTIIAKSWLSPKRMVILLRESLQRRGLELHPSKCKAQTNCSEWGHRGNVQILPDFALNVLIDGACLEVLGTSLSLHDASVEINNRIAIGWRKFWALKRLLLNSKCPLRKGCDFSILRWAAAYCTAHILGHHVLGK